jgi:hypothetical protein
LDKDDPKIIELLVPKQVRHYGHFAYIVLLYIQPTSSLMDHEFWSAYQVKASKEGRNETPITKSEARIDQGYY